MLTSILELTRFVRGTVQRAKRRAAARFAIGCAGAVAACGGGDLSKQLDSAASWSATMQLAVAEHRSGATTTTYSVQLTDAARTALEELHRSMPDAERNASDARRATAALDSLDRAIRALDAETRR